MWQHGSFYSYNTKKVASCPFVLPRTIRVVYPCLHSPCLSLLHCLHVLCWLLLPSLQSWDEYSTFVFVSGMYLLPWEVAVVYSFYRFIFIFIILCLVSWVKVPFWFVWSIDCNFDFDVKLSTPSQPHCHFVVVKLVPSFFLYNPPSLFLSLLWAVACSNICPLRAQLVEVMLPLSMVGTDSFIV